MLLRLLCISLLPALIAGQEFQCGTDKIQSDIAKTVVQFNCKDKVADINKCCISHDGCYDQQQPRGTCDATFCSCVQAASVGNPLCGFYTNLFCDTAKVFGEPAYKKAGEAKSKATAAEAPTPAPAATPSPYIPVQQGQSGPEVVAAAEAAAAAQAAAYRAAKKVTPNPLAFTPFPDPMEKMREWMQPRTRGTPAPVTPDPAEIERMRVQKLARAEFERTIEMSKQANAQLAIRDHQLEQLAEAKMRSMAERKHAHPTAAPPLAYGIPGDGGAGAALHEFQRSLKAEPKSMIVDERMIEASQQPSSSDGLALSPEQEERIAERVKEVMRKSFAQPQLKKIEPGSENAFSQDDNDDAVQQRASINIRRAPPSSSSTPSPSTASTPSLVPPPTTFNNLFHNVPSNSEPRPFAEVKTPSEATTVASVFHAKASAMDYPVVFKCCECHIEHESLSQLESHVWNRHLGTWPYKCAICNYPALSDKPLSAHFADEHPNMPVEFKRNINVECQLRSFITHSICVRLDELYDAAENEVIYEDDADQEGLGDLDALQPADQEQYHLEQGPYGHNLRRRRSGDHKELDDNDQCDDDRPPNLKRIEDDPEIIYLDRIGRQMAGQHNPDELQGGEEVITEVEVEDEMELADGVGVDEMDDGMMDSVMEDRRLHQQRFVYDEDGNLFDQEEMEGYLEEDEQGNLYYDHTTGGRSDIHDRMMKNRHIDMTVRRIAENPGDLRKKPAVEFHCDICGKLLKYPSRIEAHRRMHAQEKAFPCPHCDKAFSQKSSLNVHIRTHTGERPYACTWDCGKSFASSSALKLHEKSHSGERKHACSICGQLFSKKSHANRHEKTRHAVTMINDEEAEPLDPLTLEEKVLVDEVIESVRTERYNKQYIRQHRLMVKREDDEELHE